MFDGGTLPGGVQAIHEGVARGGYVLAEASNGHPDVLLLATGSEVALCVDAYEQLARDGIAARVVSMPSWELFDRQSEEYRESVAQASLDEDGYADEHLGLELSQKSVIPPAVTARVSVEQASTFGWSRFVGPSGHSIGMHTFGASAPLKALQKKFGFTPEQVAAAAKAQVLRAREADIKP